MWCKAGGSEKREGREQKHLWRLSNSYVLAQELSIGPLCCPGLGERSEWPQDKPAQQVSQLTSAGSGRKCECEQCWQGLREVGSRMMDTSKTSTILGVGEVVRCG